MSLLQASGEMTVKHYAGIDVSLEYPAHCRRGLRRRTARTADATGAPVRRGAQARTAREPRRLRRDRRQLLQRA